MARSNDFTFISSNGKTPIYAREWLPEGEPRGIVQLSHGIAEHISRYEHFADFLCDSGYIVVGNDHLGHGKSIADENELGYFGEFSGWDLVVGDMRKLFELTSKKYPGIPCFIFGHSMGSFLTRTYIIRYRSGLSGVVLSGTGQQNPVVIRAGLALANSEIKRNGAAYRSQKVNDLAFGRYNDGFAPARTLSDWISRDPEAVDKYVEDPLCGYVPTVGLFRDMMGGLKVITSSRNLKRMNPALPVYFISGDGDPVGENGAGVIRAYRAFLNCGMKDVTMKLYHEGRHELLNELNRDEVYDDVLAWISAKSGRAGEQKQS